MKHLPNILSIARLASVPLLIIFAMRGQADAFLILLAIAFCSDGLDGYLARRFSWQTRLGAMLDSISDFAVYMSIPICAWLLWPAVIRQEAFYVIAIICSIVMPVLYGLIKFGRVTSYHTWLTKIAAAAMALSSILLFLGGPVWLFRAAAMLCVLAAVEEIIVTSLLDQPKVNVKSIGHVINQRRKRV